MDCKVLSTVKGGSSFTNNADVGGVYNGQWIQAVTPKLPRFLSLCLIAGGGQLGGLAVDLGGPAGHKDAAGQIKTVVDNVVFPALDMILAIAFFWGPPPGGSWREPRRRRT